MELYCGIDLHSNNSYVAILSGTLEQVACRRLRNDLGQVMGFLEPYREDLVAVGVESTYNWYWLVDGLMEAAYDLHLVNTTKASKYSDMKYTDDKHDARWIARLLALGILPEGYIVPPHERRLRDLLRRRSFFVRKRADHLLSTGTLLERSTGLRVETAEIQKWSGKEVRALIDDPFVAECREAGAGGGETAQRLPAPEDCPRDRGHPRADHHVRDRHHRPLPQGGQLRLVLPLCQVGAHQQQQEEGSRQPEEREQVPVVGLLRSRPPREAARSLGAQLLRPQEEAKPSDGRKAGSGRQDRTRLLLRAPRPDAL